MKSDKPIYINITAFGVVKIILVFLVFYLIYQARSVLAALFVALLLASALEPWIDWMQKKKIPRVFGVIIIYTTVLMVLFSIIALITPPIVKQGTELVKSFPQIFEGVVSKVYALKYYSLKYGFLDNIKNQFMAISANFSGAAGGVFSTISSFFGGIFSVFLVAVMTFYILIEESSIKKIIWAFVPEKHQVCTITLTNKIQQMIGLWLRGQLILSLVIFVLIYTGLTALGFFTGQKIEYALVLALIAGLTEFIPYLGPIMAAIPAVFLAFIQSPILALSVAILYYVVQLLENNLIVPNIMKRVIGINPVISITSLLIGFKVAGVVGAVLAIPTATAIVIIIREVFEQKNNLEKISRVKNKNS